MIDLILRLILKLVHFRKKKNQAFLTSVHGCNSSELTFKAKLRSIPESENAEQTACGTTIFTK